MAKKKHESITLTFGCLQGWRVPNSVVAVVEDEADFLFPSLLAGSLINRQSVSLAALNALLKHVDKVLQICLMLTLPILARRPEVDNAVMRRNELITLIEEISQGVACRCVRKKCYSRSASFITTPHVYLPTCIFMQQGILQSFDLRRGVG